MALNAKTGEPIQNFGIEGWIDMKAGITNGFACLRSRDHYRRKDL